MNETKYDAENENISLKRTRRTKEEIERDLSLAITEIITTQGFNKLTINNLSETAHVIKRVIYDNYDSFENVLERFLDCCAKNRESLKIDRNCLVSNAFL